MKNIIKAEELFMFLGSAYFLYSGNYGMEGWLLFVLFFAPDLGMLGYLASSTVGALTYNLLHHKGIAVALFIAGVVMHIREFELGGLILFSHSSFDRTLGYGLKLTDSFHHTHLGFIGKEKTRNRKTKF